MTLRKIILAVSVSLTLAFLAAGHPMGAANAVTCIDPKTKKPIPCPPTATHHKAPTATVPPQPTLTPSPTASPTASATALPAALAGSSGASALPQAPAPPDGRNLLVGLLMAGAAGLGVFLLSRMRGSWAALIDRSQGEDKTADFWTISQVARDGDPDPGGPVADGEPENDDDDVNH